MKRHRRAAFSACRLLLALSPTLCAAASPRPSDTPAVIVEASGASRTELERVVRNALHGAPVALADDALTISNILAIGPANPRDSSGLPLNGRSLDKPAVFELFKHKSRCVLVESRTGHRWTLRHTRCLAQSRVALTSRAESSGVRRKSVG